MKITWSELVVDVAGQRSQDLLREWEWLVSNDYQIHMVSAIGDAFLEGPDGRIHWLDVGGAELQYIAKDTKKFELLRQKPANVADWFAPRLISDIMARGHRLLPGQCFSYKVPLTLNGQLVPDNFQPANLSDHFTTLGRIQRRVKPRLASTTIHPVELP